MEIVVICECCTELMHWLCL